MTEQTDLKAFHAQRIAEFRANGGKLNPPLDTVPLLVLSTTGTRSGQPHATPMSYTTDGERIVVVAAAGGAPAPPTWYHNLVANPEVMIELGAETFEARATVTEGAERERLYAQQAATMPAFNEYKQKTTREIPVVVLERVK